MIVNELQLDKSNYHSKEANQIYMSNSQYHDFLECESMALAKINGWSEPTSDAMLVGSYVHAYFEGLEAFDQFIDEHPEMFSSRGNTKGELKSTFKQADMMIEVLRNDPLCMFVMQGEKEVILTANMFGIPWKIKIDNYALNKNRMSDLKTVASIRNKLWDDRYGYTSFVEAYGYVTQLSIYAEVERLNKSRNGWLEQLLVAVSKQDPPDKEVIGINAHDIERSLEEVQQNIGRIINVKHNGAEPDRCEKCRYCRETKKLNRIIYHADLIA